MPTTVMKERASMDNQVPEAIKVGGQTSGGDTNVSVHEFAKCECCGLTEECTPAYAARVRERYQGRWICGLCAEAVNDEITRSSLRLEEEDSTVGKIGAEEEGLNRHMNFCKKFRSSTSPPPKEDLISAMKQLMLRSLEESNSPRSTSGNSPVVGSNRRSSSMRKDDGSSVFGRPSLLRSDSC